MISLDKLKNIQLVLEVEKTVTKTCQMSIARTNYVS